MFMCVSSVCFRAVSSGRAVIAARRFAAFDETSLRLEARVSRCWENSQASKLTFEKGQIGRAHV